MSKSPRPARLGDQIQAELADIFHRRWKDPRSTFFTVTGVEVTRDLRQAKIFVSTLDPEELDPLLKTLEGAKGFLRTELAGRIHVRFVPQLIFVPDHSAERAIRVETLLKQIREEGGTGDESE